jgi:magnesium transporter
MESSSPIFIHVRQLLADGDGAALARLGVRLEPSELAELATRLSAPEVAALHRSLPRDLAADAFSFLDDERQRSLLRELSEPETRWLLAELSPDDRTELFERLPGVATQRLLNLLGAEDRQEALSLLGYPRSSVGRLMSPDFASIHPDQTVAEAIDSIRKQAPSSETIHVVYVIDEHGRLLDDIRLARLILADPGLKVADLMAGDPVSLSAFDGEGVAISEMKRTGYFALPVVDPETRLLGVVTADDALHLAVEEATIDIHKGGAVEPLATGFVKAGVLALYRRRVAWLLVLVFANIFSGAGIAHFQELIQSTVALVFFLPLLIDSAGNAGSQAATLVIRGMALGEVSAGEYLKILFKEVRVSLALGATMAAAVALIALIRGGPQLAVVVAVSMAAIVFIGSCIGMSLPFLFRWLGQDPAAASGPVVTSLADIFGVLTYLGIASALLGDLSQG